MLSHIKSQGARRPLEVKAVTLQLPWARHNGRRFYLISRSTLNQSWEGWTIIPPWQKRASSRWRELSDCSLSMWQRWPTHRSIDSMFLTVFLISPQHIITQQISCFSYQLRAQRTKGDVGELGRVHGGTKVVVPLCFLGLVSIIWHLIMCCFVTLPVLVT